MEWVSVGERLPEKADFYLVFHGFYLGRPCIDVYWGYPDGRWFTEGEEQHSVTHWMPLPTPPVAAISRAS